MHMHTKTMTALCAGGVGYVLGARAGRERFEQMRHTLAEAPRMGEMLKDKMSHPQQDRVSTAGSSPYDEGWPGDPTVL